MTRFVSVWLRSRITADAVLDAALHAWRDHSVDDPAYDEADDLQLLAQLCDGADDIDSMVF
jgi:hypothetical protein